MQLLPNKEAIDTFNTMPPSQWPKHFTKERRLKILEQKAEALKNSPLKALLNKLPRERTNLTRPYPALPTWINRKCPQPVEEILVTTFSFHEQMITQILNERVPGQRFGTDWHEGKWRIVAPPSQNRLYDLMGLSHELGHILAEEPRESDFDAQVHGEALALILEAITVARQITEREKKDWLQYCRDTDNYNFEFFRREFSITNETLLHPAFIFRESLWTSHGYQAIYAAASLIRQTALKDFYAGLSKFYT